MVSPGSYSADGICDTGSNRLIESKRCQVIQLLPQPEQQNPQRAQNRKSTDHENLPFNPSVSHQGVRGCCSHSAPNIKLPPKATKQGITTSMSSLVQLLETSLHLKRAKELLKKLLMTQTHRLTRSTLSS